MMGSGLSAMIRFAAAVELEDGVALETLSIGSPKNSLTSYYEWEGAGRFLMYTVAIVGTEILVSASLLDSTDAPELLLRAKDNESGWKLSFQFVCSLERYEVQSLTRPIQVGDPIIHDPTTCWIVA